MLSTVRSASLLAFSIVAVAACGSTTGTDLFSGAASSSGAGGTSSSTTTSAVTTVTTTTASTTPDVVSSSNDATATSVTSSVSSSMDATGTVATTSTGEMTTTVSTTNSTGTNSNCSTCAEVAQGQGDPSNICSGNAQMAFAKLYDCLCQSPAGCKYVCSNNVCVGAMPTQACGGCIQISCASDVNNCNQN